MAKGKPGSDSLPPVTREIDGRNLVEQATSFFGEKPVFWGRYFKQKSTLSSDEYHAAENHLLGSNDIRLLPIGRQTTHVDGGKKTGTQDGRDNAEAVISVFGVDYLAAKAAKFLMFLDVEGGNHSLSADYYAGWAFAVRDRSLELSNGKVEALPAVYATQGDTATWKAINKSGGACAGAWIARWPKSGLFLLIPWHNKDVAKMFIWAFLAGFSERFVPNWLDKLALDASDGAPVKKTPPPTGSLPHIRETPQEAPAQGQPVKSADEQTDTEQRGA